MANYNYSNSRAQSHRWQIPIWQFSIKQKTETKNKYQINNNYIHKQINGIVHFL